MSEERRFATQPGPATKAFEERCARELESWPPAMREGLRRIHDAHRFEELQCASVRVDFGTEPLTIDVLAIDRDGKGHRFATAYDSWPFAPDDIEALRAVFAPLTDHSPVSLNTRRGHLVSAYANGQFFEISKPVGRVLARCAGRSVK
ncbi:MAG TPA: hypothetical protein VEA41_21255 [Salinarimonas sp.]|nr:hypothetical protein [Salinarimonas sp.]